MLFNKSVFSGGREILRNYRDSQITHVYLFDPDDVNGAAAKLIKLIVHPINVHRAEFVEKLLREKIMHEMIEDLVIAYAK